MVTKSVPRTWLHIFTRGLTPPGRRRTREYDEWRRILSAALPELTAWTAEGGCLYVVLGAECRASIAAFTFAETASVCGTVNPAVEIGSPTRISSGCHWM